MKQDDISLRIHKKGIRKIFALNFNPIFLQILDKLINNCSFRYSNQHYRMTYQKSHWKLVQVIMNTLQYKFGVKQLLKLKSYVSI